METVKYQSILHVRIDNSNSESNAYPGNIWNIVELFNSRLLYPLLGRVVFCKVHESIATSFLDVGSCFELFVPRDNPASSSFLESTSRFGFIYRVLRSLQTLPASNHPLPASRKSSA